MTSVQRACLSWVSIVSKSARSGNLPARQTRHEVWSGNHHHHPVEAGGPWATPSKGLVEPTGNDAVEEVRKEHEILVATAGLPRKLEIKVVVDDAPIEVEPGRRLGGSQHRFHHEGDRSTRQNRREKIVGRQPDTSARQTGSSPRQPRKSRARRSWRGCDGKCRWPVLTRPAQDAAPTRCAARWHANGRSRCESADVRCPRLRPPR